MAGGAGAGLGQLLARLEELLQGVVQGSCREEQLEGEIVVMKLEAQRTILANTELPLPAAAGRDMGRHTEKGHGDVWPHLIWPFFMVWGL